MIQTASGTGVTAPTARHGKSHRRWGTGTRRIILQCQLLHSITEQIDPSKPTGAFLAGAPLAGGGGARRRGATPAERKRRRSRAGFQRRDVTSTKTWAASTSRFRSWPAASSRAPLFLVTQGNQCQQVVHLVVTNTRLFLSLLRCFQLHVLKLKIVSFMSCNGR